MKSTHQRNYVLELRNLLYREDELWNGFVHKKIHLKWRKAVATISRAL
jgi:hypothetical protein